VPTTSNSPPAPTQTFRGLAVSAGVAIGPVVVLDSHGLHLPPRDLDPSQVPAELERLERALAEAIADAHIAEADARERIGPQYADILGAHARMIGDPSLRRQARERIEQEHIHAAHAVREVLAAVAARLDALSDPHLAARAADVRDIQHRLIERLVGDQTPDPLDDLRQPSVVLAHDLSPSETAGLDPARVLGFATEAGGRTGHTAIVAAGLEIPAVVGVGPFLDRARRAREVIVDGDAGLVVLDPHQATLERYRRDAAARAARFARLAQLAEAPAVTADGTTVTLLGNIEFPAETAICRQRGAEGIGLYRTEFLYLRAQRPPTEEEQFEAYARVIHDMEGRPVTIRTLDLGADKLPAYSGPHTGRNPFLGLRSIRLSLREPALFRTQLRAILRASTRGDVRVMFPLIATVGELRQARDLLREVAAELAAEGVPVRPDLPVGAMIEVPAAAILADRLAREVDFFSIGTNDLVQYTLAVDRSDETVADLYNAADPAVLRLISGVVQAAETHGIEVNVCGSMGGDPLYVPLLLGLGLRRFSMPPHQIPEVKPVLRALRCDEAEALSRDIQNADTADAVTARLRAELRRLAPDSPTAEP
jgi:phosphotransferase system enzyme I (PtsI)